MEIVLEGDINDTRNSFVNAARRLNPLREVQSSQSASLNLEKLHYLGPDGVSLIAGAVLEARKRGVVIDVRPPTAPVSLSAFLAFSGFDHLILDKLPPEVGHPENVTVPLRQFHQSLHQDPQPILELISRFESVSEDLQQSLEICVTELVQNVEDHSRSIVGGLGCARYLQHSREVRVALVDFGDGVLRTLQRRHPEIQTAQQALMSIAQGGYSARSRRNNRGRGFENLRSIVTDFFAGSLYIVSHDAAAEFKSGVKPRYHGLNFRFDGTAACFTLPTKPKAADS